MSKILFWNFPLETVTSLFHRLAVPIQCLFTLFTVIINKPVEIQMSLTLNVCREAKCKSAFPLKFTSSTMSLFVCLCLFLSLLGKCRNAFIHACSPAPPFSFSFSLNLPIMNNLGTINQNKQKKNKREIE